MKLHISDDLSLPIDAVTQKFGILGTSGSGKSYCAMKLAELMLDAKAQIVAVDPVGIWWSLRLMDDGKRAGYTQVRVFGGDHGDIPLTPESGGLVGRLLAERRISAVLDVSQFLTGEMKRFLTEFAEQFFQSKKSHKSPVHLFLEECQTYIPESVSDREDAKMINRWERLIKFYRNYGGGTSMISQQPQSVSKKVLNLADTLFAMRTIGSHERKAIEKWVKDVIEAETDLVKNLPKLPTGTAHVWSPSWLGISRDVKILPKTTFDAGKTPEMGIDVVEPKPLTPVDVDQLRTEMAEMIEKVKADDPKELKKEIQRLKAEAAKAPAVRTVASAVLDQRVIERAVAAAIKPFRDQLQEIKKHIGRASRSLPIVRGALDDVESLLLATPEQPTLPVITVSTGAPPAPSRPSWVKPVQVSDSNGKLRAGAARMLSALAQWFPQSIPEGRLRSHAGLKKSGTYSTYKSDIITGGYAEVRSDGLAATQKGIDYFGGNIPSAPSSTEEVLETWHPKLRDGARRMLDVLVAHRGRAISREQLFEESNLTSSGTASTYLSDLRRAQLAVTTREDVAANKDTLFL